MSFRIDHVWLFIAVDDDGEEGLIGESNGNLMIPFVAADANRAETLTERVFQMPLPPGTTVKVVRFDTRTEVLTIAR